MKITQLSLTLISCFVAMQACKTTGGRYSRLQGIENIVGEDKVDHPAQYCGRGDGDEFRRNLLSKHLRFTVKADSGNPETQRLKALSDEIYGALDHMPLKMLEGLNRMNLEIVVSHGSPAKCNCPSGKTTQQCQDQQFYEKFEKKPSFACYEFDERQRKMVISLGTVRDQTEIEKYAERLGINVEQIDGQKMVVHRDLVRTVGLIYARHLRVYGAAMQSPLMTQDPSFAQKLSEALSGLSVRRQNLETYFMQDVESYFAQDPIVKQRVEQIRQEASKVDAEYFKDYLVSEIFDSYYCNPNSHQSLKKQFSATFGAFQKDFVKLELEPDL
jgi:hypothetical protein